MTMPDTRADAVEALHAATALYTSTPVVEALLARIGWPDASGRLLDPSAGDGSFLASALRMLAPVPGDFGAADRVRGFELHPGAAASARERVAETLVSLGWSPADAVRAAAGCVSERDFLVGEVEGRYRFVAGNPPYCRFGRLPVYFRDYYAGVLAPAVRGDLMHAFLDRCVAIMPEDGVVALVTSDRWLFNQTASELREGLGRLAGIEHLARLDATTSFYRPKDRRKGSAPRVHPVEVIMRPRGAAVLPIGRAPISPDAAGDDEHAGPVLADIATVRLAPWLGPKGIFVVPAEKAADLPGADLVPVVDNDDIDPRTDTVREATRLAIRTTRDREPEGAVRDHILSQLERMPKRGRKGKWWLPPESMNLPIDRPAIMIPRIGKKIRCVRLSAGTAAINHALYLVSDDRGVPLDRIEEILTSERTQQWVARNAPRLEDGYLDIRASLIRRIPVAA